MRRGHKRYYVQYESDRRICGSNDHCYGGFSKKEAAIAAAKRLFTNDLTKNENPRNVRVYDTYTPDDEPAAIIFQCPGRI